MQQAVRLQELFEEYEGRADFYWIYVREAHPSDGLRPAKHVEIAQPRTFGRRKEVASTCALDLKLAMPVLVDDMEDSAARAYNALPDRLFILDAEGKIAYRGERGPRGFKIDEMEEALISMVGKPGKTAKPARKPGSSRRDARSR